jgi:hypothetical protein
MRNILNEDGPTWTAAAGSNQRLAHGNHQNHLETHHGTTGVSTKNKHGIDADKEAKAKRLLLPQVRGLCERHSQLPPNATETMLDVDLNTRENQAAHQLCQWLLIAEPHLKKQEKSLKEQERQQKKHPEATHHDLREHISVTPKSPARHAPCETTTTTPKAANKQMRLTDNIAAPVRRSTTVIQATGNTHMTGTAPKKLTNQCSSNSCTMVLRGTFPLTDHRNTLNTRPKQSQRQAFTYGVVK